MKVLYSWLKEYVDIDISHKELEEKLFSAGFEVEGIEYLGENLEKVVVGRSHPWSTMRVLIYRSVT